MDEDMKHICDEIGIPNKSKLKMEEYGIKSLADLVHVQSRIVMGGLDGLRDEVKAKLVKAADWRMCNMNANVQEDFDEDVFVEYCEKVDASMKTEDDSDSAMDPEMRHICAAIGVQNSCRQKMIHYGILTVGDLKLVQARSERRELNELRKNVRHELVIASKWIKNNPNANILDEFNEGVFDKFSKNEERVEFASAYIQNDLGRFGREESLPYFKDVDADEELLDEVVRQCKARIMELPYLREAVGKFDHDAFLDIYIRHFHKQVGLSTYTQRRCVISGRTQSRKTAVKAIIQAMCGLLKLPLAILTKGVDESIDLTDKLKDFADEKLVFKKHIFAASSKKDRMHWKLKEAKLDEAFGCVTHGGTLVLADTKAQVINKACKHIDRYMDQSPHGLWVQIVDEVEAMFRTRDRSQIFEQALQQLLNKNPCANVFLSATPVPFMIELVLRGECKAGDIDFIDFEPQDDYVAYENMEPIKVNGKKLFLEQNEVNAKSEYTSDGVTVCWANEKTSRMYDDAVSDLITRKGVLLLDCVCPWVRVKNNIEDKANAVQELYLHRNIPIIVITFSGSGIYVRVPPGLTITSETCITLRGGEKLQVNQATSEIVSENGWTCSIACKEWQKWRNSLIGEVLECIDAVFGLSIPVFIFGYSKIRRGISFRSNRRVPTHMVMSLGRAINITNVAQTLGRPTGNGRSVLKENGFDSVTVLTTSNDLTICIKMQNYITEISKKIKEGDTFEEAMTGANKKIPDSANFLRHTFRELGSIKGSRKDFENIVYVEDAPQELSMDEEEIRERYWDDGEAQMLLRSLARLGKGHQLVHIDDIKDDYGEAEGCDMETTKVRELLRSFVDKALIAKDGKAWRVRDVYWLRLFMNDDHGVVPDEVDLLSDNSDRNSSASMEGDDVLVEEVGSLLPRMVSHVSQGTRDSPICIDCSDDSVSSVSVSAVSSRNGEKSALVTPEKSIDLDSRPQGFINKRVARQFDRRLHFGTITRYSSYKQMWEVVYDDEDGEDYDKYDLNEALSLYKEYQLNDIGNERTAKRKSSSLSQSCDNTSLTNIDDISLGDEANFEQRKTWFIEPEKKRRVYYTGANDTPLEVAKRFGVSVQRLINDNRRRPGFEDLKPGSEFTLNSPIVIPLASNAYM